MSFFVYMYYTTFMKIHVMDLSAIITVINTLSRDEQASILRHLQDQLR